MQTIKLIFVMLLFIFYGHNTHAETIIETFPAWKYEVYQDIPSRIDPEVTINYIIGVRCPGTNTHIEPLGQGESAVCANGMKITKRDNFLECELKILIK